MTRVKEAQLRAATPVEPWTVCPSLIHLVGGEVLRPDPETYVFWNNGAGGIHSLRWIEGDWVLNLDGTIELREGSRWRVVPGWSVAHLEFESRP